MKHSKKGVTLVELVICCGILVLLGAGCTALLMSGENAFSTGAKATSAHLDASTVQTHLMKAIPSAKSVALISDEEAATLPAGNCLFFNEENDFIIRNNGNEIKLDAITGFTYSFVKAGETVEAAAEDPTEGTADAEGEEDAGNAAYARAQFVYTITTSSGSKLDGGFLLSNFAYDKLIAALEADAAVAGTEIDFTEMIDLVEHPIAFSIPAADDDATE